jgi:hypothetical protein
LSCQWHNAPLWQSAGFSTTYELRFGSCNLLGYYAASSDNSLPTFRDNISVPSSGVKNPRTTACFYLIKNATYGALWHETGLATFTQRSGSLLLHPSFSWKAYTRQATVPFAGEFDPQNFKRTFATAGIDVICCHSQRNTSLKVTRWPTDPLTLVHANGNRRLFLVLVMKNCSEVQWRLLSERNVSQIH